ncbi:TerB family tellurite resistance protein [Sinomicrobium weinanense]|uniref:TerB family tellurite resistance protein n=1 Tax=Sinomicrobium weinanense TaxID=2842200 RepID=A0A926JQK1_9FLAO|nr:TerB family tellurite resistance protein [Sinomicrobium weinanense]MBC9795494.1 TerB family tellurite resistance protein [Sinomicrobium weinanense]MBU3123359.1 TerB family tellurite resistance protein [Sinomicrobium weinanense]
MNTKKEKLSLLADMIALARTDGDIKDIEYRFLLTVAEQLGIAKKTLDSLFTQKVEQVPLKPESERILQFHRLVLLMNVDQSSSPGEIDKIKDLGIHMGLNPQATDKILEIMHRYPNKVVPPDVLIRIFKTHYN